MQFKETEETLSGLEVVPDDRGPDSVHAAKINNRCLSCEGYGDHSPCTLWFLVSSDTER